MVHTCSVSFHNGISSVFLDWKIADVRGKSLFLFVWSADLLFVGRLFYEEVFKKSLGKELTSKTKLTSDRFVSALLFKKAPAISSKRF